MRLRITVEQQQRRPFAADHQIYRRTGGVDLPLFETGKEVGRFGKVCSAPMRIIAITAVHVRRDKAALIQRVQAPPGKRSSRKQLGQAWR
jgi:hypothetical protein